MRIRIAGILGAVAICGFVRSAMADMIVVPNAQATVEGSISNFYPFGIDISDPAINANPLDSQRYQQIYSAAAFSGIGSPITITSISFRPDHQYGSAFSVTLSDIQINLSTSSQSVATLSRTFADNIGSDETIVVGRGPLSISSGFVGPANGPKEFDIVIAFDTPFEYDPSQGDLLLDVRNYAGMDDPSALTVFDAEISDSIARVYTTNPDVDGVDSPQARFNAGPVGLVTQFTFTAQQEIPEPASLTLLGIGAASMFGCGWRRKRRGFPC